MGNRQGQRNDLLVYRDTQVGWGVKTRTVVAQLLGFKSSFPYSQAKSVIQKGVSELILAMDQQLLSISQAKKIAELPSGEQYHFLQTHSPKPTRVMENLPLLEEHR